jgi:hypothetical protein
MTLVPLSSPQFHHFRKNSDNSSVAEFRKNSNRPLYDKMDGVARNKRFGYIAE